MSFPLCFVTEIDLFLSGQEEGKKSQYVRWSGAAEQIQIQPYKFSRF